MFFQFIKIFSFWAVLGVKGQKTVQNDKKFCLSCLYLMDHVSYDCHLWYMCKMIISPGVFSFFQNFDFFGCKRTKNGPKWQKNLSVTRSISQEPYFIWFPFMVHMCKAIILPSCFSIFFKILIFGLLGG